VEWRFQVTGSLENECTVKHFRNELWLPGKTWTREMWDAWEKEGRSSMTDRILKKVEHTLATHKAKPMDEDLIKEVDQIVESAKKQLQ
jgi:trimethylamine:corrinoid methyltransferase-like protein